MEKLKHKKPLEKDELYLKVIDKEEKQMDVEVCFFFAKFKFKVLSLNNLS